MAVGFRSKAKILLWALGVLLHLDGISANTLWPNHGGGILNHRSSPESSITRESVAKLHLKWKFLTGFDVSATPSISREAIYFPGWNGDLYALDRHTGNVIWKRNLTHVVGVATVSRATPVIADKLLLVGLLGPAKVLAFDRMSGDLLWKTRLLDGAAQVVVTMSGTVFKGAYFVGLSSNQESLDCCSFQGSFLKIRLSNGEVEWKTYMLPPNSGYFGAAVWGSSPSIDEHRGLVYIGTGNTYKLPDSVEQCELRRPNNTLQTLPDPCDIPENHADSIVALHVDNGSIAWYRRLEGYDVWTYTCYVNPNSINCPAVLGPDSDFGEAPMLIYLEDRAKVGGGASHPVKRCKKGSKTCRCLAVAGQKNGVVWALDCDTGDVVWSTAAGPGSPLGGASWGACTDGERVYTSIGNYLHSNFTMRPTRNVTTAGGWVAMNASNGNVLWTTANPSGSFAFGPVSVANGVVFAGSFNITGELYALDASTGSILWHYSTGRPIYGGFSIHDHCIYGSHGYDRLVFQFPLGEAVYSFCLPS